MKRRFAKLIVAALGFLIGMSLLGQEESEPCDCEMAETVDADFPEPLDCAYGACAVMYVE